MYDEDCLLQERLAMGDDWLKETRNDSLPYGHGSNGGRRVQSPTGKGLELSPSIGKTKSRGKNPTDSKIFSLPNSL